MTLLFSLSSEKPTPDHPRRKRPGPDASSTRAKRRRGRRRVRFGPGTKTHDGPKPAEAVCAELVRRAFDGTIRDALDVCEAVPPARLHHLRRVYELLGDLVGRLAGRAEALVLPRGGCDGLRVPVAGLGILRDLRAAVDEAQTRLHEAAVAAIEERPDDVTAFVRCHVRRAKGDHAGPRDGVGGAT